MAPGDRKVYRWWIRVLVIGTWLAATFVIIGNTTERVSAPPHPVVFSGPSHERDSIVAAAARLAGMPEQLAIAVSHVENWGGDSTAVHPVSGCLGLMQVCPRTWADSFTVQCGTDSLIARWRNACVGAFIAMEYFQACGNWDCALIKYVGAECTSRDSFERCARKQRTGNQYVRTVMENIYRTDLSQQRDAMAFGGWRRDATPKSGISP